MDPIRRLAAQAPSSHTRRRSPLSQLLRYVYNSNPFYAISAALVMAGLHLLFYDREAAAQPNAITFNSWLLLGVLAGYALLLAGTGWLIVRFGQVWDDARTILLTLVLLFVAISVSFDKLVLTHAATVSQVLFVGLHFSLGTTEVLLRGLRIRLPVLFRGPFYLALGLFFLYPVLLLHLLDIVGDGDPQWALHSTLWGIFLFPAAAAVVTLTLLPAALRGPAYVRYNGTPWPWPLYPWSLFVILGVAVVLRSYYLTISFHPIPGVESAFGVYFLVPFLLSVCLVVFEIARSVGSVRVQTLALLAPLSLLWLTLPGTEHPKVYGQFLALYMERTGSPVLLSWWGLLALYLYAWLRGAQLVETGLVALLALGSVLSRDMVDLESLRFPAVEPLLGATGLLVVEALRRPTQSVRWFLAWSSAIGTLTVALWDTPFVAHAGAAPLHLLLGAVLMLGLVCRDAFARFLQRLGAVALAAVGVGCLVYAELTARLPTNLVGCYLFALSVVAWSYWYALRGVLQLWAAVVITSCWFSQLGLLAFASVRRLRNPKGALLVLSGMASFLVAVAISLFKAGAWLWIRRVMQAGGYPGGSPPAGRWNGKGSSAV